MATRRAARRAARQAARHRAVTISSALFDISSAAATTARAVSTLVEGQASLVDAIVEENRYQEAEESEGN